MWRSQSLGKWGSHSGVSTWLQSDVLHPGKAWTQVETTEPSTLSICSIPLGTHVASCCRIFSFSNIIASVGSFGHSTNISVASTLAQHRQPFFKQVAHSYIAISSKLRHTPKPQGKGRLTGTRNLKRTARLGKVRPRMPLCKVEPSKQFLTRGFALVELPRRWTAGALLRSFNGVTASESSMFPKQPQ